MATASATVSRWTRGFVLASTGWLVVWQAATLAGADRAVTVPLALPGFVLHMVFGKAYALVPSYFDRSLAAPRAPAVHLPLAVGGTACLAVAPFVSAAPLDGLGAVLWAVGVGVFLGTLGWTVHDNLTGRETGTGEHNGDRRAVDRTANAAMPVALAYLGLGAYERLAHSSPLSPVVADTGPAVSHLFGAGTAALLVFAIGFRLLPRFTVVSPPRPLVPLVLTAGAIGPLAIVAGLPDGPLLAVGGALQALSLLGFAIAVCWLVSRSDRDRVGFDGVAAGSLLGVVAAGVGLWMALSGTRGSVAVAHYRLLLGGFLGLTIVGVAFQFYPPTVGRFPGAGDRLAGVVLALLTGGLLLEVAGLLTATGPPVSIGRGLVLVGALGYAYLLGGLFVQRARG